MPSYSTRPSMQSQFDMQVDFLTELARAGIDALRRLTELNRHLARQLKDDAVRAAHAMLSGAQMALTRNVGPSHAVRDIHHTPE
ncbi:hypothetical protein IV454_29140 [Massilia antarctica]|uniref:Phasin family protein n=1 Tax=Massilia antarctica TaxID=2765360 RepID=A0AA49A7U5_9BURK|nr:hypothetical protein [Massilia antarctica]QPI49456.1 hypothetical protein IV454_29140 [Massilia antarctica]